MFVVFEGSNKNLNYKKTYKLYNEFLRKLTFFMFKPSSGIFYDFNRNFYEKNTFQDSWTNRITTLTGWLTFLSLKEISTT